MKPSNNCPLTLADILLIVLEQMEKDEKQKSHIRKVRTLMNVPDFAEYLHFLLMDALGHPIQIAVLTVDKAIDCLVHLYENNISENPMWKPEQKVTQIALMKNYMDEFRNWTKVALAGRNLLK